MKHRIVSLLIALFAFSIDGNGQNDTIELYYDIGVYKLNKKNYELIESYINNSDIKDNRFGVTIISSADFLGSTTSNHQLANKRANHIKEVLGSKGDSIFTKFNIINKGEVSQTKTVSNKKEGELEHRKSTIVFKKINVSENTGKKNEPKLISNDSEYGVLEVGKTFRLNNLFFYAGTARLKEKSKPTLIKLARFLKKNDNIEFDIIGHLCCNADNRTPNSDKKVIKYTDLSRLSVKRANLVYKYLYSKGIRKERMQYYGYQFQLPLHFPERTAEEKNANKRVEIKITKM